MVRKLISVLIPVYNTEKYLNECINSVLNQTYKELEIILIDDGSTDSSGAICDKFADLDARIKVIHNNNSGVSVSRNTGIEASTGEYICFVDSDDFLPLDSIEKLYTAIVENEVEIVFGNYCLCYNGKLFKKDLKHIPGKHSTNEYKLIDDGTLSGITFGNVWGAIYSAKLIKDNSIKFNENLKVNEDGIFNIKCCNSAKHIYIEKTSVYNYRKSERFSIDFDKLKNNYLKTNKALEKLCYSCSSNNIRQLAARKCFSFYNLAYYAAHSNKNRYEKIKKLRELISDTDKLSLDYKRMNIVKRILWHILDLKMYVVFIFIILYIFPIAKDKMKH